MTGTLINAAAIIIGCVLGIVFGRSFSEKLRDTIMSALGIFVIGTGVDLFLKSSNSILPLAGIVIGICIGEALNIEEGMERLGGWFQTKFSQLSGDKSSESRKRFIEGFLTASLLYCIGPMAILGSIQNGLGNGIQLLVIKSILDGVTAIAFASTLGIGVAFSAIPVFVYQGAITLLAVQADTLLSDAMVTEMSAAGGIMLVAIGVSSLLGLKKIRVSSMLPALLITPLIVWITGLF